MISIELNQTRLRRGGQRLHKSSVDRVAMCVANELRVKQTRLISVAFVSEKEMRKLNLQYRGNDRVTDVLSFNLEEENGEVEKSRSREEKKYGEIILNYEQAKRQAKTMKHSVRDELTFLIVHGLLHVFGFDHELEADAKKMFAIQTKILTRLNVDPKL